MNSTTHATSLTSAGLHRWRTEIQMFYEQTAVELNRIVSAIDDYKQSTTQAVANAQRSVSLSREFSVPAAETAEIEPTDTATPVPDTAPIPLAPATNSSINAQNTAARPQPGIAATQTDRTADRALDRASAPLSTREATPQDRLALLKQQIAAKLSASPRDEQKTEEPRS